MKQTAKRKNQQTREPVTVERDKSVYIQKMKRRHDPQIIEAFEAACHAVAAEPYTAEAEARVYSRIICQAVAYLREGR